MFPGPDGRDRGEVGRKTVEVGGNELEVSGNNVACAAFAGSRSTLFPLTGINVARERRAAALSTKCPLNAAPAPQHCCKASHTLAVRTPRRDQMRPALIKEASEPVAVRGSPLLRVFPRRVRLLTEAG